MLLDLVYGTLRFVCAVLRPFEKLTDEKTEQIQPGEERSPEI